MLTGNGTRSPVNSGSGNRALVTVALYKYTINKSELLHADLLHMKSTASTHFQQAATECLSEAQMRIHSLYAQ